MTDMSAGDCREYTDGRPPRQDPAAAYEQLIRYQEALAPAALAVTPSDHAGRAEKRQKKKASKAHRATEKPAKEKASRKSQRGGKEQKIDTTANVEQAGLAEAPAVNSPGEDQPVLGSDAGAPARRPRMGLLGRRAAA